MPFTIPEALSDIPELLDLVQTIAASANPPATATATAKSEADRVLDTIDAAMPKLTALVRKVIAQTKD